MLDWSSVTHVEVEGCAIVFGREGLGPLRVEFVSDADLRQAFAELANVIAGTPGA